MQAPSVDELLKNQIVLDALEQAWVDSAISDAQRRHEEGGWVYLETANGKILIERAPVGGRAGIDLAEPRLIQGCVVIATFHTHPNPASEGWHPGPSRGDTESARLLGVPCIIRAEDGIHVTGPTTRRGGWSGGPGYPP
jgi:hypothetical protein